jgi:hypothetical protein
VNGDNATSLTTAPTCSTTASSSSPAGSYPSTCSGAADPNYTISYVAGTVTLTPAPLTITATSATMTYGGTVPVITPIYNGFVNGNGPASLSTDPTCSTTATSSSPPGSYPSTCSGASGPDYTVSFVAGTVTVTAARLAAPAPRSLRHNGDLGPAAPGLPPRRCLLSQRGHSRLWRKRLRLGRRAGVPSPSGGAVGAGEGRPRQRAERPRRGHPPNGGGPAPRHPVSTRAVNGSATIYVAGTDGELHGFSTSHQFFADGYDAALVVTVPSLDGLRVGATDGVAGAAMTALATRADGAIVDSSGTFYVFAGGRAFGISTPAELVGVQKADPAEVLVGSVGPPQRGAAIATGALISAPGKVYVSYQGALYLFKTLAQLANDGYGGTAAAPVAGPGGLSVVVRYSGS